MSGETDWDRLKEMAGWLANAQMENEALRAALQAERGRVKVLAEAAYKFACCVTVMPAPPDGREYPKIYSQPQIVLGYRAELMDLIDEAQADAESAEKGKDV